MNPLGPRLPLADLAVWTGSALVIFAGALVSWLLARALVFGVPELVRWAADVLDLTGQS